MSKSDDSFASPELTLREGFIYDASKKLTFKGREFHSFVYRNIALFPSGVVLKNYSRKVILGYLFHETSSLKKPVLEGIVS